MNRSIRAKHRKTYRTLAIIGNGFDLNHHYATGYNSFIEATNSKSLDLFKEYCAQNNNITTWYLFEDNINRLTQDLFFESIKNSYNNEAMKVKQSLLRDAFADIHNLLIQYLRDVMAQHPVIKKPSIKKYLKRKTMAVNFNYTNTASTYACDVFHVHGSLAENDILLGYDYRDEACLAGYEDMRWNKDLCREAMAFRRYLKNELWKNMDRTQTPQAGGSPLGDDKEWPIVMVDGEIYEWRKGRAACLEVPEDLVYYGQIIHVDKNRPKNDCEFRAIFDVSGDIYVCPSDGCVYICVTTDWMEDVFVVFDPVNTEYHSVSPYW